jgi:hypothetical protein
MKTLVIGSFVALLALQVGCQKTDPPAPPAIAIPVPVPVATTTAAPAEAASAVVVADAPTEEDYEATAEKTIAPTATPGVLTQQLDQLEKEIGK